MRYRFWIALAAVIGFAPPSFGQLATTACPECAGTVLFVDPSAMPVISCPDCSLDLDKVSIPSSCSDLGGTVDGSQCKLADGQTCAVDNLSACMPLAPEEPEDWGEDAASAGAVPEQAAGAADTGQ